MKTNREFKFRLWDPSTRTMDYNVAVACGGAWDTFRDETIKGGVLMQYTGLLDRKGKRIYEGDVVRWAGTIAAIEWLPRMAGWYAMKNGSGFHFHEQQVIVPEHGGLAHIEVIGNIHENPDLLNPVKTETCWACDGDGVRTCSNPDCGLIQAIGGETGRLGCPECGHKGRKFHGETCDECNGTGQVPTDHKAEGPTQEELDAMREAEDEVNGEGESLNWLSLKQPDHD